MGLDAVVIFSRLGLIRRPGWMTKEGTEASGHLH